jgi:proline iminopeptidase
MGLDHTCFRPWLDPLASTHSLIYYDHLGNGRSPRPGNWDEVTHASWADDADALREHLGFETTVVLGHSYAGFLALEYALRHPTRVRGLVLVCAAPVFDHGEQVLANAGARGTPAQAQRVVEMLTEPMPDDEAMRDAFEAILPLYFHRWDPGAGEALVADLACSAAAFNHGNAVCLPTADYRDRLGEITAPTLVISASDDWIMPAGRGGERLAQGIPGARYEVIDKSGHFPFVERRHEFLDLLGSWIAELPPGAA